MGQEASEAERLREEDPFTAEWTNRSGPPADRKLNDEWTGEPDRKQLDEIRLALKSTVPRVLETLKILQGRK